MGLLSFALAVVALISGFAVFSKTYDWVIHGVSPGSLLRKNLDRLVSFSNKVVAPVLIGAFCIFVVIVVAVGAWDIGIDILKRFACQ